MKGVVLAGGLGTRLDPLTRVTNKHLLPVYDRPMIFYPLWTLINAGIEEILIVTGGSNAGDFLRLLGNGAEFGLKHLNYTYQQGEGGIAAALSLAEHFAEGEKVCVILGDNIIERNIQRAAAAFRSQARGAKILLKRVPDPQRFGVAVLRGKTRRANRREAAPAAESLRGDGHLFLRWRGVRLRARFEAIEAGRARDHRREQSVHRSGHDDVRDTSRLVDRRGDVRVTAPCQPPGCARRGE